MKMKQKAIVLSVNQYSFKDEKAGKVVEGCGIHYLTTDNLLPFADEERSSKGYKPAKDSMPLEAYAKTAEVPGIYNLDLDVQVGSDGTAKIKVVDLEFIGLLD